MNVYSIAFEEFDENCVHIEMIANSENLSKITNSPKILEDMPIKIIGFSQRDKKNQ